MTRPGTPTDACSQPSFSDISGTATDAQLANAYSGVGTCTNQVITALTRNAVPTCTTDTLASAQHANQGSTTTVLHGNAAGNPSWASVAAADFSAQSANTVLAGPTSGAAATPTFRSLLDADIPDTITLTDLTQVITRSHATLQNLLADDHTQYALLAGRSGGQTLIGGTAANNNLTLNSTSNTTKGSLSLDDGVQVWNSSPNPGASTVRFVYFQPSWTSQSGSGTYRMVDASPTITVTNNSIGFQVLFAGGTFTQTVAPVFSSFQLFAAAPTLTSATAAVPLISPIELLDTITLNATANNVGTTTQLVTVQHNPSVTTTTADASAAVTLTSSTAVRDVGTTITATTAGQSATVTNRRGLMVETQAALGGAGTKTLTNNLGVDVAAQTVGTNIWGVRSSIASGAARFNIDASGTAQNRFAGNAMFGHAINTATTAIDNQADTAFRTNALTLATGGNNNLVISGMTFVRITGPTGAFNITGTSTCQDGQYLILYNATAQNMTITNNSGLSTCKILTLTGADITTTQTGAVTMIYDVTGATWVVTSLQA